MKLFAAIELHNHGRGSVQAIVLSALGRVLLQATLPLSDSPKQALRLVDEVSRHMKVPCILAWNPEDPWPYPPRESSRILPVRLESVNQTEYDLDPPRSEYCPPDPYGSVRRLAIIGALKHGLLSPPVIKYVPRYVPLQEPPVSDEPEF